LGESVSGNVSGGDRGVCVTNIWLVRHGEAAASFDQEIDPGLSLLGHEQAVTAAQQLSAIVPPDAQLLSSPKQRALQTGAPFVSLRDAVLQSDERFIELPSPEGLAQRSEWLQQALAANWSALPTAVHELAKWHCLGVAVPIHAHCDLHAFLGDQQHCGGDLTRGCCSAVPAG
jgi:hypothetical protein